MLNDKKSGGSFVEIAGYERVKNAFKESIKNNNISHAYIITGATGSGKNLMANAFAKAVLCLSNNAESEVPVSGDSCGACVSCRSFENGNNPDVIYTTTSKKSLGVDEIRQTTDLVYVRPYQYDYKILIIDDAHTMTAQAQNALLKTLEEPPAYCVFILLANDLSLLLPTVLSRCVPIKLNPLPIELISSYLTQTKGLTQQEAKMAAAFSNGSIGRALEISGNGEFISLKKEVFALADKVSNADLSDLLLMSSVFEKFKEQITEVLDLMLIWCRDKLVVAETGDKSRAFAQEPQENQATGSKDIFKRINAIQRAKYRLSHNGNFTLCVQTMLMEMV